MLPLLLDRSLVLSGRQSTANPVAAKTPSAAGSIALNPSEPLLGGGRRREGGRCRRRVGGKSGAANVWCAPRLSSSARRPMRRTAKRSCSTSLRCDHVSRPLAETDSRRLRLQGFTSKLQSGHPTSLRFNSYICQHASRRWSWRHGRPIHL